MVTAGIAWELCVFVEMQQKQLENGTINDEENIEINDRAKEGAIRMIQEYRQTGVLENLSEANVIMLKSLGLDGEYSAHAMLAGCAEILGMRFEQTGNMADLNHAVEAAEMTVDATPQDHPDRATYLNNFVNWLDTRFKRTGDMADLNRAIEAANMAVDVIPQDHPDRAMYLNDLGNLLGTRFRLASDITGDITDLNRAIEVGEMAADITTQDHPGRAILLTGLGNHLRTRFTWTRNITDLNRAIEVGEMAADITAQDHSNRAACLNNFGSWLSTRFKQTSNMADLNRAIEATKMAVDIIPHDHLDRAKYLNNLGNSLGTRFERIGDMSDLSRAVEATNMAVDTTPQDHPDRAMYLNNLGNRLNARFKRIGDMADINRAIEVADMAVDATPRDHLDRAMYLNNLGSWLNVRYQRTGYMADINRAVETTAAAVDMTVGAIPQDHPDRVMYLSNLGNSLGIRFERTNDMTDLNRAVEAIEMAVNVTPRDHPDRLIYLKTLGGWFGIRFKRIGDMTDLNRAIEAIDMVVNITPRDHPNRAVYLNSLGNWLGARFERTGNIADLDYAINAANIAVDVTPRDHPNRAAFLNNLGTLFYTRFERTDNIADLNHAVEADNMAVDAMPQDHPNRAGYLNNLGKRFEAQFKRTNNVADIDRALSLYKEGWHCQTASPSVRIYSAHSAAHILASNREWEAASSLLEKAIELLPLVSPRSLNHTDKQSMLAGFSGLASRAAAISIEAGRSAYDSLRLLELGRGVIASLLMDMRGDISVLEQQHPDLANQFRSLRDAIDSPVARSSPILTDNAPSGLSQTKLRYELDEKFSELIATIRAKPGFDNFLLPPTEKEVKDAACLGPIIIVNLSHYRCDAFLVERDQIRLLGLPDLKLDDVRKKAQSLRSSLTALRSTLEWLWDVVCGPSLDALGLGNTTSDNKCPRVWWIPTGLLSQFPLHAAGYHERRSTQTVLDRVMSSYAPSVKALIHGRTSHVRSPAATEPDHALLVAMKQTLGLPGNQVLPFVENEVEMLKKLYPSLNLKCVTPTLQKDEVMKFLQGCKIFHFAGHGSSHSTEPSQSSLLLEDWKTNPLTVGDIRDCRFQENPPFLGYLSACLTSSNEVEALTDEGIHLVSAFQLAGFRHVIGSLWEVSDKHCVDMARIFYETMRDEGLTDLAVCQGLHQAMKALRDGQTEKVDKEEKEEEEEAGAGEARHAFLSRAKPLKNNYWIPYVHFGV